MTERTTWERTSPAASVICTYIERNRRCRERAVGEYPESWAHRAWPLCERHMDPKWHPPDVARHLKRYGQAAT
jgi:hypothetical protein